MFSGRNTERQKCAVYPQPLSALLFSSWRNCWSANIEICHSLFPHFDTSREGGRGRRILFIYLVFARLGYDVNKMDQLAGMKWAIMLESSANCPGEREISKGLLRHSSWGCAVHPLAYREDPQTPSYVHISDRLAAHSVCEKAGVWSASKAKSWVQHSLWPVNSSRARRQQTYKGGNTNERLDSGDATQHLTTAATQLITKLLWIE